MGVHILLPEVFRCILAQALLKQSDKALQASIAWFDERL